MRFLNTNNSCVHTHTHTLAHKRIYTYKPSMLFTRTFSQQRGSGVFSFHPTHAILVSHTVQQTKTIICMHAQGQIHTFSHANLPFFFPSLTPTATIFLALEGKNAHRHMHQINTYKITMVPIPGAGAHFV